MCKGPLGRRSLLIWRILLDLRRVVGLLHWLPSSLHIRLHHILGNRLCAVVVVVLVPRRLLGNGARPKTVLRLGADEMNEAHRDERRGIAEEGLDEVVVWFPIPRGEAFKCGNRNDSVECAHEPDTRRSQQ